MGGHGGASEEERVSGEERKRAHARKAAAIEARISESGRGLTEDEIAERVRAVRGAGREPTVEAVALDASLAVTWWKEVLSW